jgi:acetyltransferase-like isoleucine patch superfamily enzyme
MTTLPQPRRSHGTGLFDLSDFSYLGEGVVFETGVLAFHPENIEIGHHVYIGHNTILKAYYKHKMIIGDGTWIGQQCFFHSAGNIVIGKNVGIGPSVKIITSFHREEGRRKPILHSQLEFAPVTVHDDCDIGVGTIILPGVTIGCGAQIGAGAVVSKNLPPYAVAAGVPARIIRMRS